MEDSTPQKDYVRLILVHSVLGGRSEKNFKLDLSVKEVKDKLYAMVGTEPQYQQLQLRNDGVVVVDLADDNAKLQSFNPIDDQELYITDTDPKNTIAELIDPTKVEKYVMSDEVYASRNTNYRKWKQENSAKPPESAPEHLQVGQSVNVLPATDKDPVREGTIAYIGNVEGSEGYWVGVHLKEPLGKNDGSVKGKRYFTCEQNYGVFVKPNKINITTTTQKVDEM